MDVITYLALKTSLSKTLIIVRYVPLWRDTIMNVREATNADFDSIWPIFHEVVAAGDTYAYSPNLTKEQAFRLWMELPRKTFLIEDNNKVEGTYYIKTNQGGPGDHVCNCGYMVSANARGKGLATTMCKHSQKIARQLGYKAMQFNFVVSTNVGAIRLWDQLGYETVGHLPKAFKHPSEGYVDALVMFKWLE